MAQFEHYRQQLEQTQEPETRQTDNLDSELADLPEKLKGKTVKDIAQMYVELEKLNSRQANELGELRRTVQPKAEPTVEPTVPKERPQVSADELLAKPIEAIDQVIETHPSVIEAREAALRAEKARAQAEFSKEYPKYQEDLNDHAFVDWVKKNPARVELIQRANNYDVNSARALWGMWHEHKELAGAAATKAREEESRRAAERAAELEGSSGADADSETIYSRAEWTDLQRRALLGDRKAKAKWEDPKFRELRQKAYAEGRVK